MQIFVIPLDALVTSKSLQHGSNHKVVLTGKDFHYLAHVRRLVPGDRIPACTPDGTRYLMTVTNLEHDRLKASILPTESLAWPPSFPLTIVMAVVKPTAMDLIIRQATELGVATIFPIVTERSIPSTHAQPRVARWQRIARSATQQSGRERPPEIKNPQSVKNLLEAVPVSAIKLLFHPPEVAEIPVNLPPALDPSLEVWLLIGPEGGFSQQELSLISSFGFRRCSLGSTVLRTDTAAVSAITTAQLVLWWGNPQREQQ